MSWSFKGVIMGRYVSMKNGRRAVRFGARSAFIKKPAALDWEQLAMMQIRRRVDDTPYEGPVALVADFYYADVRADLDENLLKDMLQLKNKKKDGSRPPCLGIIKNDSQVKAHRTRWHLDKAQPRVVFMLLDLESYDELDKKRPQT